MTTNLQSARADITDARIASMFVDFQRQPGEANLTSVSRPRLPLRTATLADYGSRWLDFGWAIPTELLQVARNAPTSAGDSVRTLSGTSSEPATRGTLSEADKWAHLEAAAEVSNEREFMAAFRNVDWSVQSADSIVRAIRLALAAGAPLVARRLATEGTQRYPEHSELQKAARILAPPRVVRRDLPPDPGMAKNVRWLRLHHDAYRGQWVGLRDGQLLGTADSLHALLERFGKHDDILCTIA